MEKINEKQQLKKRIEDSVELRQLILSQDDLLETVVAAANAMITCFRDRKKVLFCGNGGSASDALHLAAELAGRFYFDRPPLHAEALAANMSYLTAVANDYEYDEIFARALLAQGVAGDILVGLSTSGCSKNVVKAFQVAKNRGVKTIALTGKTGGHLQPLSDYLIPIPSQDTARIQECHILLGHVMCELVEKSLFQSDKQP